MAKILEEIPNRQILNSFFEKSIIFVDYAESILMNDHALLRHIKQVVISIVELRDFPTFFLSLQFLVNG